MTEELYIKGKAAKEASYKLAVCDSDTKNKALLAMADALCNNSEYIIQENERDIKNAQLNGIKPAMIDRLMLNTDRIKAMADGIRQVASLHDPIGETINEWDRPNGLKLKVKRVPIGVIAIIYEARPNVTADACALCLKSSNTVILRGGKEAINSNTAIMKVMQKAAYSNGIPEGSMNIIENTSREVSHELMKLREFVDLLIPRGGKGLINSVVDNAAVHVIETAAGNCHIYVDSEFDKDMAINIILNAKISRPSVCNAAETLLIHKAAAEKFLPEIANKLKNANVEIRGCKRCEKIIENIIKADENDWFTEYNDYIIAIKIVDSIDDAISHINKYNTGHSEAIITSVDENKNKFLNEVDAACVYVNASTRFTDGFEFGFGAEIGISTQKIHARGPMGLEQLTSIKYHITGNGQIR